MKRLIIDKLVNWKNKKDRKPLILKGVRQCGKTYILKQFGIEYFKDMAYFNFEDNPALAERFDQNLDPKRIIMELGILLKRNIDSQTTLIIFDEIQVCERAYASIFYFYEQFPEYHIVCASSFLGRSPKKPISLKEYKLDILTLYPMNYYEFVLANKEKMLLEYIENFDRNTPVPQMFTERMINLLKTYFIVGGMPKVIKRWIETKNLSETEKVQDEIINSYELDFAKYSKKTSFHKLSLIKKSIPYQLAKANKKFTYGHVKPGARAKDLKDEIEWLIKAGMVHKVCKILKPSIPLSDCSNSNHFKLYMADIGLLRRIAKLPAISIFENSILYNEFKEALTENYILCELLSLNGETPFYWDSGNTAKVDYIAKFEEKIVPIEVKASPNIKSRSLGIYKEKYLPDISIRTSILNLKKNERVLDIPLYMFFTIEKRIKE